MIEEQPVDPGDVASERVTRTLASLLRSYERVLEQENKALAELARHAEQGARTEQKDAERWRKELVGRFEAILNREQNNRSP